MFEQLPDIYANISKHKPAPPENVSKIGANVQERQNVKLKKFISHSV